MSKIFSLDSSDIIIVLKWKQATRPTCYHPSLRVKHERQVACFSRIYIVQLSFVGTKIRFLGFFAYICI